MEFQEDSLDLRRYLDMALRWWWVIILLPVVLGIGVYVYSKAQTKMYQADATMLVQQAQSATPTLGDLQTSQRLAITYERLITTRPILEQVATEMGLFDINGNPDVGIFQDNVSAATIRDTQILQISVRNSDRVLAADMANTLARVFRDDTQLRLLSNIARLQALAAQQGIIGVESLLLDTHLAALGNLTIVEDAVAPGSSVYPRVTRNTAIGIGIGIVLGILLVFLFEALGNTVRSAEQVEKLFETSEGTPSMLGVVFKWPTKDVSSTGFVTHHNPESIFSEMFRQVRTGFNFVTTPIQAKALLITSVAPSEGKSTLLTNIGAALAQGGSRVIILESEMRRPSIHRLFGMNRSGAMGLSDYLANTQDDLRALIRDTDVPNLRVLLSGTVPPNAADLLSSSRMTEAIEILKSDCDLLLMDSPPVLAAADPVILASYADGVVFVVSLGESRPDTFKDAVRQINRAGTPILGYVLNKVKSRRFGYYSRYRYYYYYPTKEGPGGERKGSPTVSEA